MKTNKHHRVTQEDWDKLVPMTHPNLMLPRCYCDECGRVYCCYPYSLEQPNQIDENGFGGYEKLPPRKINFTVKLKPK